MYPGTHGLCQSLFEPGKDEEANIWGKDEEAISWRKGPVESDPGLRTKILLRSTGILTIFVTGTIFGHGTLSECMYVHRK
jgi:hypothetical protein